MDHRFWIPLLIAILMTIPVGAASEGGPRTRESVTGLDPRPIYDGVLEVPPGGESRLVVNTNGEVEEEGYIGPKIDPETNLGQASLRLPEWLREDFLRNVIASGSEPFALDDYTIPAFGDLDADGDDDLVIGSGGALHFYRNVGSQGCPIYISGGWSDWFTYLRMDGSGDGYISPSIYDIDGDGYGEIIWGDRTEYLNLLWNHGIGNGVEGDYDLLSVAYIGSGTPPTHLSPAPVSSENGTFRLYIGSRQGQVYYWEFGWEENGTRITTELTIPPSPVPGLGTVNFSAPRIWRSQGSRKNENDILGMMVGSGDGVIRYYPSVGGHFTRIQPDFFLNIATRGRVTPVPANFNGDLTGDLTIGTELRKLPEYINFGTNRDPYWAPDPHTPAFQVENYESSFDGRLSFYNESLVDGYLDSIINPPDNRYTDEIGFACAFTPPSQLACNRLADLLVDNAEYIYDRASNLDYVKIKEHTGSDPYTTTAYRIRTGGSVQWMEIPREVYYWGVVHPRITEEPVAYIDPDTGSEAAPEDGGCYWREYLWNHADDSYPPGPTYPDDYTGRRVFYPRNFTPPLLREVLSEVNVLWDLEPYEYPRGFDDRGDTNDHQWDYRDHAIEKVSHWVEKTLPLNQQESQDDERPVQPVRIAASHNGNCGELQDLTIAAARSALIPTRGAHLTGEDHVWSEFYLGGWHQWDNYWSDGGGVIANDLNYWWGWGGRGGSGIWASNGAGQTFDIGGRYRPPEINGKLRVTVLDRNGAPVDGARVLVMSHWVMETIDTGPYQGPLPTVPLPSIWGYTDQGGICELTVWRQNINIRVTSDIGTYISGKFSVPEKGGTYNMTVILQSSMPHEPQHAPRTEIPTSGNRYLLSLEVIGSFQEQRDLTSGVLYREEIEGGGAFVRAFRGDAGWDNLMYASKVTQVAPLLVEMRDGNDTFQISISDMNAVKNHVRIRVRLWKVIETDIHDESDLVLVNGQGRMDRGIGNNDDYTVAGWVISSDPGLLESVRSMAVSGPLPDIPLDINDERWQNWSIGFHGSHITGIPGQPNALSVDLYNTDIPGSSLPFISFYWEPFLRNFRMPAWMGITDRGPVPWGATFEMGVLYGDPYGGLNGIGWLDDDIIWTNTSGRISATEQSVSHTVDSGDHDGGVRKLRITTTDPCGNIHPLVYNLLFDPVPPTLNVTSPLEGDEILENTFSLEGKVGDDVIVGDLVVSIGGDDQDIMNRVREDGSFGFDIELNEEPGPIAITVNATDDVNLWTSVTVNITLLPPEDTTPPVVRLESPDDGSRYEKGDIITFRGTAYDDSGLSGLYLTASGKRYDVLESLEGRTFSYPIDTSSWTTGTKRVILKGSDPGGNSASSSIEVIIHEEKTTFRDLEPPSISIVKPAPGEVIPIGTLFHLIGQVTDDGKITLMLSTDRGASYEDVTPLLNGDWDFDLEVDSLEIARGLHLSPDIFRSVLEDYPLFIKAVDGAGRETILERHLDLVDKEDPVISSVSVDPDIENNRVLIDFEMRDLTMIDEVWITVTSPDRTIFRQMILRCSDLETKGDGTEGSFEVKGPFESGKYSVTITAHDPWGNTVSSETEFTVPEKNTGGGSAGIQIVILILSLVLSGVLAASLLLYGAIRLFRKESTTNTH